jgi:hypothetical protein
MRQNMRQNAKMEHETLNSLIVRFQYITLNAFASFMHDKPTEVKIGNLAIKAKPETIKNLNNFFKQDHILSTNLSQSLLSQPIKEFLTKEVKHLFQLKYEINNEINNDQKSILISNKLLFALLDHPIFVHQPDTLDLPTGDKKKVNADKTTDNTQKGKNRNSSKGIIVSAFEKTFNNDIFVKKNDVKEIAYSIKKMIKPDQDPQEFFNQLFVDDLSKKTPELLENILKILTEENGKQEHTKNSIKHKPNFFYHYQEACKQALTKLRS